MATPNDTGDNIERVLVPKWAPELVVLSYCISWLGAYTSTQIVIHAKYTRNPLRKWVWTFLASLAFGFCAIWSMHFVGMLACRLDVKIGFDGLLTVLSAVVAVVFTFAALSSSYVTEVIEHKISTWNRSLRTSLSSTWNIPVTLDPEVGYQALPHGDEQGIAGVSDQPTVEYEGYEDDFTEVALEQGRPLGRDHRRTPSPQEVAFSTSVPTGQSRKVSYSLPAGVRNTTVQTPPPSPRQRPPLRSIEESTDAPGAESNSRSSSDSSGGSTLASGSMFWGESLHVGLSQEARARIKSHAQKQPLPERGWREWARNHYETLTLLVLIRAAIWGMALVLMHYCGMWAMYIPGGRIVWNTAVVALSYVVAFAVCLVACITMERMEVHFGRQVAFSTIAALGCCSMHYTGMAAATFYTYSPPSPQAGYPTYLPFTIIGVAVLVCVVSNVILAHSAIIARNRMAEIILTKRRLWRIMAEKEAAEQAAELKQQFISVASHEIRTPLHTVNGYCELLSRTDLTEEQLLYVSSIQQACHALNVIAGNVLDFSKLDRNNLELSARPPGQLGVDVVLSVTSEVPTTVYLDETYTFRVLMNLLSNAQKFCEQGYICVGIPQSFRAALFEPFQQADTSPTRPRQGTGLGLSIVKHLVQRMSGTVDVESAEGEGSTFIPPRLRVVYSHRRTQELLTALFALHGFAVSAGARDVSAADIVAGADALWADAQSVAQTPARELAPLEPELAAADNVVLVKRPVVLHALVEEMARPEARAGARVGGEARGESVRFALAESRVAGMVPRKERGERDVPPAGAAGVVELGVAVEGTEKAKVLLVEDNVINEQLGRRLLEKLGYEVVTANDGEKAVEAVKKTWFHACLMDCQMPVLDGFAATRLIRESERDGTIPGHLPIIALTANVTSESEAQCRQAGMDHFLPKPLKLTDLHMVLQRRARSALR
ncbi:histidine kinase [Amylocystis lapponica]|nr:histidine kinase [Amylocystis lapponica]